MEVTCCFIPAEGALSQTGLRLTLLSQFDPWDISASGLVGAPMVVTWGEQPDLGKRLPVRGSVEQEREEFTAAVRGWEERPGPGAGSVSTESPRW